MWCSNRVSSWVRTDLGKISHMVIYPKPRKSLTGDKPLHLLSRSPVYECSEQLSSRQHLGIYCMGMILAK